MDWIKKGKFWRRKYKSYNDYIKHQQSNLNNGIPWLKIYDETYRISLYKRLCELEIPLAGKNVLCLGAMIGTEVKAFLDANCFAVGIDLNPGTNNTHVLPGDFHNIIFPDSSVDIIFTNSIGHAFNLGQFIKEGRRVLKDSGYLIIEVLSQQKEGEHGGPFEATGCDSFNDILDELKAAGYKYICERTFDNNSPGIDKIGYQYILQNKVDIIKDYNLC